MSGNNLNQAAYAGCVDQPTHPCSLVKVSVLIVRVGSKPVFVLEQGTFTSPKVLVIPRKRWLRPNMTEKLFTGTLRINQPTKLHYCENKGADHLISTFIFTTKIVQSIYFLNPRFQTSIHIKWLYSPVCVEPGPKPQRQVFSWRCSINSVTI